MCIYLNQLSGAAFRKWKWFFFSYSSSIGIIHSDGNNSLSTAAAATESESIPTSIGENGFGIAWLHTQNIYCFLFLFFFFFFFYVLRGGMYNAVFCPPLCPLLPSDARLLPLVLLRSTFTRELQQFHARIKGKNIVNDEGINTLAKVIFQNSVYTNSEVR